MSDDDKDLPVPAYRDLREVVKAGRARRDGGRAQLYALEIPTAVIVGCILGQLADTHLGVAPWGFPVGLAAGVGSAIRSIVRLIAWQKANDPDDDAAAPPAVGGDDVPPT